MKKIDILFISILALLSCSKNNSSNDAVPNSSNVVSSTISVSSLPATVTNYISDNYPDATIYSAATLSNSQAKYIVLLSTEEELAFDIRGNFLGDGQDFCHGGGPFPGGDSLHHGHPWHGCPPNWINIDSLASSVKSFVTTNYPNYVIWHAETDSVCPDGSVIEVMIRKPGTRPPVDLTLFFSTTDSYIMVAERIRYSEVPQAVRNYISANFRTFHQCLMSQQLTLADDSTNYAIYVNQYRMHKRVVLTSGGTLVCEQ